MLNRALATGDDLPSMRVSRAPLGPGSKISLVMVAALGVLFLGCGGGGSSEGAGGQPQSLASTVDALAVAEFNSNHLPGMVVAIGQKGTVLYAKAYGYTDVSASKSAQPDTVFEIGSVTKQFTAAAIMQLQEAGKLNIDDSASAYLTSYGFPPQISIRMLLTHTSGLFPYTSLPDFGAWADAGVAESTVLTKIAAQPLNFSPGSKYEYSNSNYFLLGAIIEGVSGVTYPDYLSAHVFGAADLQATYYEVPPASTAAVGYVFNGSQAVAATPMIRSAAFAAGALSSTVGDLVKWDDALAQGKIVSPSSYSQMIAPTAVSNFGYGFGLGVVTLDGKTFIEHNGNITGFNAFSGYYAGSGVSVVVLANGDPYSPGNIAEKIVEAACRSVELSGSC